MGFSFAAAIPAAIQAVGSLVGGERTNAANQSISRDQMAFQERMSSTAYQRSMADMRAAGLNPILAYKQGGASAPPGASIAAVNSIEGAVNSARNALKVQGELDAIEADVGLKKSSEELNRQLYRESQGREKKLFEEEKKVRQEVGNLSSANQLMRQDLKLKQLDVKKKEDYGDSITGRNIHTIERIVDRILKHTAR